MIRYTNEIAKVLGVKPENLTDKQRLQLSLLIAQAQVEAMNDHKVAIRALDIVEDVVF